MILVVIESTSDASTGLENFLRANQSIFLVRNIVAFIFKNKCLVSNAKIPFNNFFAFSDHTILHSINPKSGVGMVEPMKSLSECDMARPDPEPKTTKKQSLRNVV